MPFHAYGYRDSCFHLVRQYILSSYCLTTGPISSFKSWISENERQLRCESIQERPHVLSQCQDTAVTGIPFTRPLYFLLFSASIVWLCLFSLYLALGQSLSHFRYYPMSGLCLPVYSCKLLHVVMRNCKTGVTLLFVCPCAFCKFALSVV